MTEKQDRPRERSSEELLTAKAEVDRWVAFCALVEHHGKFLVVEARRIALLMGLAAHVGDEAVSEAFIRLGQGLDSPWPRDRPFLERYRGEVWSELRHRRAKLAKLRDRFRPMAEDLDPEAPAPDPERQYQSAERLSLIRRSVDKYSRTEKQRVLARAWSLSKEGYDWSEVKEKVDWPGTCDSLRASVSRFFGQMRSRIQEHIGWQGIV